MRVVIIPRSELVLTRHLRACILGVVGLAGYLYLEKSGAGVAPKKVQEKSPFDPENFLDFKLKRVESYNHNTAKYVRMSNCFQCESHVLTSTFAFNRQVHL